MDSHNNLMSHLIRHSDMWGRAEKRRTSEGGNSYYGFFSYKRIGIRRRAKVVKTEEMD